MRKAAARALRSGALATTTHTTHHSLSLLVGARCYAQASLSAHQPSPIQLAFYPSITPTIHSIRHSFHPPTTTTTAHHPRHKHTTSTVSPLAAYPAGLQPLFTLSLPPLPFPNTRPPLVRQCLRRRRAQRRHLPRRLSFPLRPWTSTLPPPSRAPSQTLLLNLRHP